MSAGISNPFAGIVSGFLSFLPSLLAGIGLVALGLLCGWLAKKLLVQLAIIVRLDRLLSRSRWKEEFSRSDVRHGLFALAGNFAFFLVLLVFVDNAFLAWNLTVLSDLLRAGIVFLPGLLLAAVIFGAGWLLSSWTRRSVLRILLHERVQRATLIARFVQAIPVLFFSAMALVELDVAREIVIVGFTVVIVTFAALTVVFAIRQEGSLLREPEEKEREGASE